jgi:hypothetical protein
MARAILLLVTVGVTIYAIVDCLRSHPSTLRWLPKPVWLAVCLVFLVGPLAYLFFGRVDPTGRTAAPQPRRPQVLAPDDDPEFLRSLGMHRRRGSDDKPPDPDADEGTEHP